MSFLILVLVISTSVRAFDGKVCGTNGSVEERIKDCSEQFGVGKNVWTLISRNGDGKKIWLDPSSTLIWTEPNNERMEIRDADQLCTDPKLFASNKSNLDIQFRLPTCGEFAYSDGEKLFEVIPNLSHSSFGFPYTRIQWCKQINKHDLSRINAGNYAHNNTDSDRLIRNGMVSCVADYSGRQGARGQSE
jgi:hypothetical protein